ARVRRWPRPGARRQRAHDPQRAHVHPVLRADRRGRGAPELPGRDPARAGNRPAGRAAGAGGVRARGPPVTRVFHGGNRNASSWAMRAWLALREAGVAFEERIVDLRPPQRFAHLARIGAFSPPAAVPVLVDGDAVIFDSLAIMEYANDLCGGGLLPRDAIMRARA